MNVTHPPPRPCLQVLGLNLTQSGLLSVLPWVAQAVMANVAGWAADNLVERGVSITTVRKVRVWCAPSAC